MIKVLNVFDDVNVKVYSDGAIETVPHVTMRRDGKPLSCKGRMLKQGTGDSLGRFKGKGD